MVKDSNLQKTKVLYGGVLFGNNERKAIEKVLDQNWWGLSKEGKKFEAEIAKVQGVKRAIFVNSGSSALDVGIRSMNLPKGSEVIVPACTFPTPISSLIREGLTPVVADVELGTYFYSIDSVKRSISKKTSAILVVYVAGAVGDLDKILSLAKQNNLKVIEDNCDGFGGTWKGKMLGSFGEFSAISTHAAHIISTGEGGVILTNNNDLADRAKSIRDWGRITDFETRKDGFENFPSEYRRYFYPDLGSNFKPLELQAAMGRVQLKRLKEFKSKRKRNFSVLREMLEPFIHNTLLPFSHSKADPCWYTFPITLTNGVSRKKVLDYLDKAGIEWRPILAGNIAWQPAYKKRVVLRTTTPNADKLINDSFWVSVHPKHSVKTMRYVGQTIINALT